MFVGHQMSLQPSEELQTFPSVDEEKSALSLCSSKTFNFLSDNRGAVNQRESRRAEMNQRPERNLLIWRESNNNCSVVGFPAAFSSM